MTVTVTVTVTMTMAVTVTMTVTVAVTVTMTGTRKDSSCQEDTRDLPVGTRIPTLQIKFPPEASPPKSRILVRSWSHQYKELATCSGCPVGAPDALSVLRTPCG